MKCSISFYIILLFLLQVIYSCNGQETKSQNNVDNAYDSIIKDIPKNPNGKESNVYKFIMQMANKLNIEKLDNGFDSIQIRIWCSYSFKDTSQMLVLKKVNNNWVSNIYTIFFKSDTSQFETIDTLISKQSNLIPKSGWKIFTDNLFDLKIKDLPDMDSLPGNEFDIIEGNVFSVEVATKNKYRLYTYVNPYEFEKIWWQAKNMENILQLIEKEFNFKRIRQPSKR